MRVRGFVSKFSTISFRGYFLAFFMVVFCLQYGTAQNNFRFNHLSIQDGLSQNSINCIFQDRQGFMWFGTEDGLNKYDGYRFEIFKQRPDEPSSLSHNFVYAIHQDQQGYIWIGTYGGGLNRYDPMTESFSHYRHVSQDPHTLCNDKIFAICPGENQTLWLGTDAGLSLFDIKEGTFTNFIALEELELKKELTILTICLGRGGMVWLGTMKNGLVRFDPEKKKWKKYGHDPADENSISNHSVWSISEDDRGGLWIGTRHGLNQFDPQTGVFARVPLPGRETGDSYDSVYCLMDDSQGNLWIGTWGSGILLLNRKTGAFLPVKNDPLLSASLSSDFISALHTDRSGLIWVGTYGGGLNRFNPRQHIFKHYYHHPRNLTSLSQNTVFAIYEDRAGELWIGTHGGGLNRFLPERNGFKHYRHQPGNPGSLSSDEVWDIKEDYLGYLWVATRNGLNRLDQERKNILVFKKNNYKNIIANDFITTIIEDHARILWIGSYGGGLSRYHRKSGQFELLAKSKVEINRNVYILLEDKDHRLWIGTYGGGLYRLDEARNTLVRFEHDSGNPDSISHNEILSLFQDTKGRIWVGTLGGGLNKYEPESKGFVRYQEKDGLANGVINGIMEDARGRLWLTTYGGISCFHPDNGKIRNFDARDGLQSNEFNKGAACRSRNGCLLVGGINGFNVFDPESIELNQTVPPVVITAFFQYNKEITLDQPVAFKDVLNLSHRDKFFSFEFSLLDYTIPEKNKYAYKLEGFHDQWIQADYNRNSVNFTNLDPGSYVFKVKGANNDGIWNETGTSLRIVIHPPFWQLWWFQALAILIFAIISYLVIGLVRKYISLTAFWRKQKFFGKFRLIEKIGSGGMGTIYKAQNTMDPALTVALKIMREELFADEVSQRRFKQEAAIIDQLEHPNIVRIIERGQHKRSMFIAMELLVGTTLADRIQDKGKLSIKEAIPIMVQIADALVKIHGKNIIHRDLKPANIMLVKRKKNKNYVKLLDFGLAKMENQTRVTQTGMVVGTVDYMSPEQVSRAEFSPASDIYSLGALFYEMVTAVRPFSGDSTIELMNKILNDMPIEPLILNRDVPDHLNLLLMKMLAKKVEERPTVSEVYRVLSKIQEEVNSN